MQWAVAEYIKFFSEEDGQKFKDAIDKSVDILLQMKTICSNYKQYAHTEYMLKYFCKTTQPDIVHFVSYYDMCSNCEKLWAEYCNTTRAFFVSYITYVNSRQVVRTVYNNPNLILMYR